MELPGSLPLLLDGATGTQLIAAGMPADACPELWALEHPAIVTELQRRYILAGSDVLYAPTFGANRARLAPFGLADRTAEFNRRLAALSREAVVSCPKSRCRIAGVLSPTGLGTESPEDAPFDKWIAVYAEQAAALKEAGVDLLVCETMTSLGEARAALLAARETGLPVIVTLTVNREGETASGGRLLPAVITLQSLGAAAVGLNCSVGPACMAEPIAEALPYASVPLVAKPSTMAEGGGALSPLQFGEAVRSLMDAGATIVGGCCGASPEHVAVLRGVVDQHPTVAPREIDTDACAVESEAFFLADDLEYGDPLPCDSDLADRLIEAEEEGNVALVELSGPGDLSSLLEFGGMSRLPIALHADHPLLLDEALRRFPGRLLVDSLCEIERPLLEDIAVRYGAVVF